VYVETTVPGYLTAWPSRDVILLGHQQTTKLFWDAAPARYDLVISEAVLEEIAAGDAGAAAERIRTLAALPVLQRQPQVDELALYYRQLLQLPDRAAADALHLAFAVVYEVDYLVTWNMKHLANGAVQRAISIANDDRGIHVPLIVTPEALLE
jgi:predicted nucleic acid-binding protein